MRRKVTAIITAGGTGSRFAQNKKSAKPKQFVNLLGKPVIVYSMLAFQKCKKVDEIIISAEKNYFDYIHSLAVKYKIGKLNRLVEGGKTRFNSVRNAFESIEGNSRNDFIIIHDAARPNISPVLIENIIDENSELVTACRISETVKRSKKGYVSETLNRENLWSVQTPQAFRYNVLQNSYKKCGSRNDFTDEASVVEFAGYKVKVIENSRENIKITSPEDLSYLKKIMK